MEKSISFIMDSGERPQRSVARRFELLLTFSLSCSLFPVQNGGRSVCQHLRAAQQ
jgi:hypothetical protein